MTMTEIQVGPWHSIDEIRAANEAKGECWFSPETMRWFGGRVLSGVYGGRLFVTSEKDRPNPFGLGAWGGERRYTVRCANDDGSISTFSEFGEFDTAAQARGYAKRMA
jgi:hypothetical protein